MIYGEQKIDIKWIKSCVAEGNDLFRVCVNYRLLLERDSRAEINMRTAKEDDVVPSIMTILEFRLYIRPGFKGTSKGNEGDAGALYMLRQVVKVCRQ